MKVRDMKGCGQGHTNFKGQSEALSDFREPVFPFFILPI